MCIRDRLGIGQVNEVVLDDVDLLRQALKPAQDLAFTGPQNSVQHHVSSSLLRFRSHPGPRRRAPPTMNREADRPVVPGALAGVRPEPQQGARYVVLDRILRVGEGKILRRLKGLTEQVNVIEDDFVDLTDAELRALTDTYRERLADGETEDDLLPEAFATVREAAKRTLGQRHFDVQLMGGAALHLGSIAEMKTGEGKTLVGTLPAYLNALSGTGVH